MARYNGIMRLIFATNNAHKTCDKKYLIKMENFGKICALH